MFLQYCVLLTLLLASSYCAEDEKSQVEESLHQMCLKNANEEAYQEISNIQNDIISCYGNASSYAFMITDIIMAHVMGNINEVSKRHCDTIRQTVSCAKPFADKLEKCFSESERTGIRIGSNITDTLIDQLCNNGGNFINEFASKGGLECLGMRNMEMWGCLEPLRPMSEGENYIGKISAMKYDTAECNKLSDVKNCLVGKVDFCIPPIPKMIKDLITSTLKVTPCQSFKENDQTIKSD